MDNPGCASIFQPMNTSIDILIIGGGLNGPTLALAAAKAGLSSTVIDARPEGTRRSDNFDGRSYALALASVRMLNALGLWDGLKANAQPMTEIKVSDGRAGDAEVFLACISTVPRSRKGRWATCSKTGICGGLCLRRWRRTR